MQGRLQLLMFALAFVVGSIWIALNSLEGGFLNYIKSAILLVPLIFILVLRVRERWLPVLVGAMGASTLTAILPFYGIRSFTPSMIMILVLLLMMTLDRILQGNMLRTPMRTWIDWIFLFMSVWMTVRFAYDRPGFVGLGSQQGGFTIGLHFVFAGWAFFVARDLGFTREWQRRFIPLILILCLLGQLALAYRALSGGVPFKWYHELADAPYWLIVAVVMSLLGWRMRRRPHGVPWAFLIWTGVLLVLTLASRHRSRIVFVAAEIMVVAWIYRRSFSVGLVMGMGFVALILVILTVGGGIIPEAVSRPLSLFLPERLLPTTSGVIGPQGWQDSFRKMLYEVAWSEISKAPILGHGFRLDVEEALSLLAVGQRPELGFAMLAWGGAYHNSLLTMAMNVGMVVPILFAIVQVAVFLRFTAFARRMAYDSFDKVGASILSTFWLANMGMALINGHHQEALAATIICGLMEGMRRRVLYAQVAAVEVKLPTLVPARAVAALPGRTPGIPVTGISLSLNR